MQLLEIWLFQNRISNLSVTGRSRTNFHLSVSLNKYSFRATPFAQVIKSKPSQRLALENQLLVAYGISKYNRAHCTVALAKAWGLKKVIIKFTIMSVHLKKKIQFYGFSSTAITDVKKKPVLYADGFSEIQVKGLWIGRTLQGSYLKLFQNVYIFGTRCYLLLKFAFQKKIVSCL